ncbi:MAG: hypothetical protein ABSD89_11355 [Halobacteriota archaeon]|jgi:hypothetical protein
MDYYESVVMDYLRADRALFVNTECCIQISRGHNPDKGITHWYCDAVVADFRSETVFLCEISYSLKLAALIKRLKTWNDNWESIRGALARESALREDWLVRLRPWLFVPSGEECVPETRPDHHQLLTALSRLGNGSPKFIPRITPLEMVQPWRYCSWDRIGEIECCPRHKCNKPEWVPEAMAK